MIYLNKEQIIKEIQRILLENNYSVKCVKDIGNWMSENLETAEEYINKPEFRFFLNKLESQLEGEKHE